MPPPPPADAAVKTLAQSLHNAPDAAACATLIGGAPDEILHRCAGAYRKLYSEKLRDMLASRCGDEELVSQMRALLEKKPAAEATPAAAAEPLFAAEAAAGLHGANKAALCAVLTSSSQEELKAVAMAFEAQAADMPRGSGGSLLNRVGEVCGRRGAPLRTLLELRLSAALARPSAAATSTAATSTAGFSSPLAGRHARQLYAAGKAMCGTDEDAFIELIGFADAGQAAALRYEYAMRYGHTLGTAVADEMSGDLAGLLGAFLDPPPSALALEADAELAEEQAARLWRASQGWGYDSSEWISVLRSVSAPQLAQVMRTMALHGLPLTRLIADEFSGDAKQLLLVRCRWAAAASRVVSHRAAAAPPAAPAGRISASDPKPLRQWAALIAATGATRLPPLLQAYRDVCGGAELYADVHAHAPEVGGQRRLLLSLLLRAPADAGDAGASSEAAKAKAAERAKRAASRAGIALADVVEDLVSAGGEHDGDGAADEALAEAQAEALLLRAGWRSGGGAGGAATPRAAAADAHAEEDGRGSVEEQLLALLGSSSLAHLAAVESEMCRRLLQHTLTQQQPQQPQPPQPPQQHAASPTASPSGTPRSPTAPVLHSPRLLSPRLMSASTPWASEPALQSAAAAAVRSGGALALWSKGLQLPSLGRVVLESRLDAALLPSRRRLASLRQLSRKLFGGAHDGGMCTLLGECSTSELDLVSFLLTSEGDDASRIVEQALPAGQTRTLLQQLLRPRTDARPEPVWVAEAAAELRSSAAGIGVRSDRFLAIVGAASDAQLRAIGAALAAQRGPTLERLVASEFGEPTRALLLRRCALAAARPLSAAEVTVAPEASAAAKRLYRAGRGRWFRSDRGEMVAVLTHADAGQVAALRYEYAMRYGHTLGGDISHELAGESQLETLLPALADPADPACAPAGGSHAGGDVAAAAAGGSMAGAPASPASTPRGGRAAGRGEDARTFELVHALSPGAVDADAIIRTIAACGAEQLRRVVEGAERAMQASLPDLLRGTALLEPDLVAALISRLEWAAKAAAEPPAVWLTIQPPLPPALPSLPPPPPPPPAQPTPTPAAAPLGKTGAGGATSAAAAAAAVGSSGTSARAAQADASLLRALPRIAELATAGSAVSHSQRTIVDYLVPDEPTSARLVALICGAVSERDLDDLRDALQSRVGLGLTRVVQLVEQGMSATVRPLLLARVVHPPMRPPTALRMAEVAAELATCSLASALQFVSYMSPPSRLGAFVSCVSRQHGQSAEALLAKRFRADPAAWAAASAMLRAAEALDEAEHEAPHGGAVVSEPSIGRHVRQLHAAGTGLFCGTDEDAFIELIGFADAGQAAALRYEYAMRYGHTLGSAVADEMSGDLARLLRAFLDPPPSALEATVDAGRASKEAAELHLAAEGIGTTSGPFVNIFGRSSAPQLDAMLASYESKFKKPLVEMLRHEFFFDSDLRKLLVTRCRWALTLARDARRGDTAPTGAAPASPTGHPTSSARVHHPPSRQAVAVAPLPTSERPVPVSTPSPPRSPVRPTDRHVASTDAAPEPSEPHPPARPSPPRAAVNAVASLFGLGGGAAEPSQPPRRGLGAMAPRKPGGGCSATPSVESTPRGGGAQRNVPSVASTPMRTPQSTPRYAQPLTGRSTAGSIAQPVDPKEAQRAKHRLAIQRTLASSDAAIARYETGAAELQRAAADAEALHQQCEARLGGSSKAPATVQAKLRDASQASAHMADDLQDTLDRARRALDVHRDAHDALAAALAEPGSEPSGLGSYSSTLRDAQVECRRAFRQGEQTQAQARSALTSASIAVSQAVAADRHGGPRLGGGPSRPVRRG